jgi:hypothetical protein
MIMAKKAGKIENKDISGAQADGGARDDAVRRPLQRAVRQREE